jgi:TatD DNase family protein
MTTSRAPQVAALVDTHCHLDLYPDPAAAIRKAEAQGVLTIAVTNIPSVYAHLVALVGDAIHVRVALGLHPQLVHERVGELPLFLQLLPRTRYVGEVGLDYVTQDQARRKVQRESLASIVQWCAEAGDKIVTVHSRRATDDVVDVFGAFPGTYILHWYSGSARALNRALAHGAFVSVNPAMVRSDRTMSLLQHVPRERVLTETDGPFVDVNGRPAHPSDVSQAVEGLASLWHVDAQEARAMVYSNFARVLRHSRPG